jgi:hypothetical protein
VVKRREAATVELQWRRLWEMVTGKERRCGATAFIGEEGEEVRRLHDAGGGRHSEEQHGARGGQRRRLLSGG